MRRVGGAVFLGIILLCAPADAQVQRTYWGVEGGFVPEWKVPESLKQLFDADSMNVKGNELRIGFVRGSILGGDWGVSLVRKHLSDESTVTRLRPSQCAACGTTLTATSASMTGVEVHKFASFGTIKDRVQIGLNFGGGVAQLKGHVRETVVSPDGTATREVDAKTLFTPWGHELDIVPLAKLELAVTGILAPDLKIRAGGGIDFPGYDKFNVSVVYFFGAR